MPNGLKGAKARFRLLSGLYGKLINRFRVEIYLTGRLYSYNRGEEYVRCGILDKVAETVDR